MKYKLLNNDDDHNDNVKNIDKNTFFKRLKGLKGTKRS